MDCELIRKAGAQQPAKTDMIRTEATSDSTSVSNTPYFNQTHILIKIMSDALINDRTRRSPNLESSSRSDHVSYSYRLLSRKSQLKARSASVDLSFQVPMTSTSEHFHSLGLAVTFWPIFQAIEML